MNDQNPLSLVGHLEELRARLLWSLSTFVVGFLLCYAQTSSLVKLVMAPLRANFPDIRLSALTITEGFFTTMKLAAWAGFVFCLPVLVYHVWQFVRPGLLPREQRFVTLLLLPMALLFVGGCSACYFGFLPFILKMLVGSMGTDLTANFSYSAYVDFIIVSVLMAGVMFELPLLMVFLDRTGIWPVEKAVAHRRHSIVAAFVVGGVLSPPDVLSQFLVTLPLLLLLEIGIHLAFFFRNFQTSSHPADV